MSNRLQFDPMIEYTFKHRKHYESYLIIEAYDLTHARESAPVRYWQLIKAKWWDV